MVIKFRASLWHNINDDQWIDDNIHRHALVFFAFDADGGGRKYRIIIISIIINAGWMIKYKLFSHYANDSRPHTPGPSDWNRIVSIICVYVPLRVGCALVTKDLVDIQYYIILYTKYKVHLHWLHQHWLPLVNTTRPSDADIHIIYWFVLANDDSMKCTHRWRGFMASLWTFMHGDQLCCFVVIPKLIRPALAAGAMFSLLYNYFFQHKDDWHRWRMPCDLPQLR